MAGSAPEIEGDRRARTGVAPLLVHAIAPHRDPVHQNGGAVRRYPRRGVPTTAPLAADRPTAAEERSEFERDGHVSIRALLTPDEVERYRPAVLAAAAEGNRETRALEDRDVQARRRRQHPVAPGPVLLAVPARSAERRDGVDPAARPRPCRRSDDVRVGHPPQR